MTAVPPLPDAEARRCIREDLDRTVFVEAAAGTGKTTALVERIVSLLREGRGTLDRIVAVTFTEKAAGEMKLRLRAEIERAREASAPEAAGAAAGVAPGAEPARRAAARARLDAALEKLELARIGTIHGFCADLLHERPVEAGVDPLFQVAPAEEADGLLDAAFDAWFQRVLSDPPEGVRRVLRRRGRGRDAGGPREALRSAVHSLREHRDFDASWRRDPGFDRAAAIDAALAELEMLVPLAEQARDPERDWLAKNLRTLARFVKENRLREQVRGRDHDLLEAELRDLLMQRNGWHWRGHPRHPYGKGLDRAEVAARRDAVKETLRRVVERCDADLAACLRDDLRPVIASYQERKRRAGVLDFVDLLVGARDLLLRSPEARRDLQQRFTHYFVDEFQDTDPLQAEILLLLAADDPDETDWRRARPVPGRLFLVGDPKQAIYRFRRADVAIYEKTKARLAEQGAAVLHLTTSFRAPPSLQELVNAAFAPLMQGAPDGSQARYVPLEGARTEVEGRPTVVALPAPRPYGDFGTVVKWRIDESLADATAAFVDWLIRESGWTVAGVDEQGRRVEEPIRPRHVCLLFRRFKSFREDVTRPYVRGLEARRIPHVLVGGRSFHDREEVLALRNALMAIEWPDDELRVFATLRGPLFALGDDALLAFRHRHGSLHPLRPHDEDALEGDARDVAECLALLRALHARRNRRPVADTVSALLEAVRAHAGIAIWPTGEQALANCLRVVDLARRFERHGATSFRAFVDRLDADAARGDVEDAPVVEEGTEGVRIMTAHRAKGLEFPVVVLCDPTCNATRGAPTRYVVPEARLWAEPLAGCTPLELIEDDAAERRRDEAEAVRLAYVAATRARDLLVVPVVADAEQPGGWLGALGPALHPDEASPGDGEPWPGVPPFGREAIVLRPENARRPQRRPVRPGGLRPRAGRHTVVWWDPNALALDVQQDVGLRQQRILVADESGVASEAGAEAHARWQRARGERLARGAAPTLRAVPVTALAEAEAAEAAETGREAGAETVPLVEVASRAARPHGRRFGTLVHALLAVVSLDADGAEIAAAAALQGRLLGAAPDEVEAAAAVVGDALAHPVLRRAAASAALRRETPVLLAREDGRLAEGVVDLAFREQGADGRAAWTVVDFKTDREIGARRDAYALQVQTYADAIARATGEPARGLLLVV